MLNHGIEGHDAELDVEADIERILAEFRDALERVLQEHLGVRFSHGLCPDCGRRLLDKIERSGSGHV